MTHRETGTILAWIASLGLLVVSGLVQGHLVGRWRTSPDLLSAVRRLDRLPLRVDPWIGEDEPVDQPTLTRAGIIGGIQRRYRHAVTGSVATVLLVCGRPGPIAVHTPDVCYQGAGYEMVAPPREPIPGFLAAEMIRVDTAVPDSLQVYWSWSAGGRWEVPNDPRLVFATCPYLYKLYVVRTSTTGNDLATTPAADLVRSLASVLNLEPAPSDR